jgi:hypothetical protein
MTLIEPLVVAAALVVGVRRARSATHAALAELDHRALRDLGFDRSEIESVAAEVEGVAERTRVRSQVI